MYTVVETPEDGNVISAPTWNLSPIQIVNEVLGEVVGLLSITSWLSSNGWFGKKIDFAGIEITSDSSPVVYDFPIDTVLPTVTATPTASAGLKYTISFFFDIKLPISNVLNLIVCGIVWTNPPRVWNLLVSAAPTRPLFTLKILLWSKVFNTNNFSVPIPILLPAETVGGIVAKYMSVTIPAVLVSPNPLYNTVLSELTPILWEPVNLGILVVNPDITTTSLVFKVWVVEINPETVPFPPRTKTTSLNVVTPTVKLPISLPSTFDIKALAPPPSVFVLSKFKLSPTS